MPRTAAVTPPTVIPRTISGLWALCALTPLRTRTAYEDAASICARLSVRRLTAVQREYFQELLDLVEAWEDAHDETGHALRSLRNAAAGVKAGGIL